MGDFSLVPSLVVLLVVVVALVAVSTLLRRRAKQRPAPSIGGAPVREPVDDLLRRASIQLVQMDDAIRAATDELEFTRAEFGEERAHDFAQALDTAKRRASEAFAIQQRLDDAVPDTEQERRDGGKRILALSDAALALVTTQSRSVQEQRRRELGAPDAVRTLRERVASARARLAPAAAELASLSARYDPAALRPSEDDLPAATRALDSAEAELDRADAEAAANPLAPLTRLTQSAERSLAEALSLLDAVTALRASLARADADLGRASDAARQQRAEADRLRDTVEDADAAAAIVTASARVDEALRAAATRASPHPLADLDSLETATAELDRVLAVARTAQQRLDSARTALAGALRIAESHIGTADSFISGRRGRIGPDARTRLASARRELELARLEADPVAALDAARRAATLATDADALARYDTR